MSENVEIKAGGVYRTRGGAEATVKKNPNGGKKFPFLATTGMWTYPVTETGHYHLRSYSKERSLMDLVEPLEDEKPTPLPAAPVNPVPAAHAFAPTRFRAEDFKSGDWVKVVAGSCALKARGISQGDVVLVENVSMGFVRLTEGRGAWDPWRFEPAAAPQVQSTTPEKAPDVSLKDTNPKDAIGSDKLPLHLWPTTATAAGSTALLNGALKYGRANWRHAGVRATIYADAIRRHLDAWLEGEEVDPDDGVPHLWAILAGTAILVDAKAAAKLTDDRNAAGGYRNFVSESTAHVKRLKELHKGRSPKHYTIADLPKFP
jgi:hypothetical protein